MSTHTFLCHIILQPHPQHGRQGTGVYKTDSQLQGVSWSAAMKLNSKLKGQWIKHQGPVCLGSGPLLAHIITALHSSHLTCTAFITVTLTMAVCQRTGEDREEGEGGGGGVKMHSALCSRGNIRMQGRELQWWSVRLTGEKKEKTNKKQTDGQCGRGKWMMVRRQIDGGCCSPFPEMVRSCVRKLSWMCDSDRVVWARRWYLGPLSTHKRQNILLVLSVYSRKH